MNDKIDYDLVSLILVGGAIISVEEYDCKRLLEDPNNDYRYSNGFVFQRPAKHNANPFEHPPEFAKADDDFANWWHRREKPVQTIEEKVNALVESEQKISIVNVKRHGNYVGDPDIDKDFVAYCLLSDHLRHLNLDKDIVAELRRQYPHKAQEAQESYYDWLHDL